MSLPLNCDFRNDCGILPSSMPFISVIIAVYKDWTALDTCLQSLTQQRIAPEFEVIVVDDGSDETAPQAIAEWAQRLPLTMVRQVHAGISAARNHGIQASTGSILLFVDADCRLQPNCLAALAATIAAAPQHSYFQLRLVGDGPGVVGRSENLRLVTLQNQLLQPNGCIRYLNTAGFAIRRTQVNTRMGLFDATVLRAEDTLLLAHLIEAGEMPFFVADAIVQHVMSRSIAACLRKDALSAYLETRAYDVIAAKGVKIRMSNRDRLRMFSSMWKMSRQPSVGISGWLLLITRQALCLLVRMFTDLFGVRPPLHVSANSQ
jgi:glycosyltransferase involved in cell wall biosynthesis